jgi:hypothetical protein
MNPDRLLRQLLAIALTGLVVGAVLQGCTETPEPPTYRNPFDPDSPSSSNPFQLEALVNEADVILSWTPLEGFGLVTYIVQHRINNGLWSDVTSVGADVTQFIFDGAEPTATNSFRVVAENEFGDRTSTNPVVPVSVNMPPVIVNANDSYTVASRLQDFSVLATVGDSVQVSLSDGFAGALQLPRDPTGTTAVTDFDLGTAAAGSTVVVYARTLSEIGGSVIPSARGQRGFAVAGTPAISLVGGGTAIATPVVDLAIAREGAGIDSMRFAGSEEGLSDAAWRPGAPVAEDVPVTDTVAGQTIWAEYARDFGFTATTSLAVQADDLSEADFTFEDLDPNRIVDDLELRLRHDAVASELRASQYPDFRDADWVPFPTDSLTTLTLVEDPERLRYDVFVQYRNHWFQSAVRTDFVIKGPTEIRVAFTNPLQNQFVPGGGTIEVSGTAESFDATVPIDSVQVHLGDRWQRATGTTEWEIPWEVPLLEADTTWQIGVLAHAGQWTGYAWIPVTVSQFTLAITAPVAGAEVTRGSTVNVTGTATPYGGGAPLDSVVVTVIDQRLLATGLESWSAAWEVPQDAPELIGLTAWAYAGEDSLSQTVNISAVDPGR